MRAPAALILTLVVLSSRLVAIAAPPDAADSLGDGTAIGGGLAELRAGKAALDRLDRKLDSRIRGVRGLRGSGPLRAGPRGTPPWRRGDRVRVLVRLDVLDDASRTALRDVGLAIERESPRRGLVGGWIPVGAVRALAALDAVRSVRPAERGHTRTGSLTSVGDRLSIAEEARRSFPVTGSGVRVGVISDGIDGVAASQATGDLPGPPEVPAGCSTGDGSEGTAMLEIVHDLAPGATLLFASGIQDAMTFIGAVECLTAAGADVIVDDLGFFDEPFFEDGDLADAVRTAVQAGVSYHTAAGNHALAHYEAPFRASPGSRYHDFSEAGGVDNTNGVTIPPGGSLVCVLQWDNPFGNATDDYDLLLVPHNRNVVVASEDVIAASDNVQNGRGDDPREVIVADNTGRAAETAGIVIERARGAARTLELFCIRDAEDLDYVTPGSSVFGHAAVAEAIAVAAIDVGGPLDVIEPFSARGPAVLAFPPESRPKPDLAAFDGVGTTVPGFNPFFGTSAAAPHVAAIAALVLERNPFLAPADVQGILAATAVDIGPPGFDDAAGAGRVNALAAVAATPLPCVADADCDDGDPCTVERCSGGRCTVPPSCDDGNPCNGVETCRPEAGGCVAGVPAPDGTPCADATVCNGDETCAGGACVAGPAPLCVDGDTCTADVCSPEAGCQFPALEGLDSVRCVLDRGLPTCPGVRVPASVERRFERAQRLITRAESAPQRRRQRRLVTRAARALRRAATTVERARHLPEECATSLAVSLGAARDRARAVAQALR